MLFQLGHGKSCHGPAHGPWEFFRVGLLVLIHLYAGQVVLVADGPEAQREAGGTGEEERDLGYAEPA